MAASPYGGWEEIEQACRKISALQGPLVVMDCIGYSFAMKREVAEKTEKTVVLSRTMAARVISELSRYLRPDCELRKGKKAKMYAHQGHKCIQRRQKQKESCIMHIKKLKYHA